MQLPAEAMTRVLRALSISAAHPDTRTALGASLEHFAAMLPFADPKPDGWGAQRVEDHAELIVLGTGRVLVICIRPHEQGPVEIGAKSYALDPVGVGVSFEVGEQGVGSNNDWGTPTAWTFSGSIELVIGGFISEERDVAEPDRLELLARNIAAAVGWPLST